MYWVAVGLLFMSINVLRGETILKAAEISYQKQQIELTNMHTLKEELATAKGLITKLEAENLELRTANKPEDLQYWRQQFNSTGFAEGWM